MYAYISGKIADKANNYVVIDNGGMGYKIFMSPSVIEKLPDVGEFQKIHTYYYVREDVISLYGFLTNEELRMFELLLSVSGIGAKSAIQILSSITPSSFALAVISNDVSKIVKIPGIGNKTAARIILELKDKLKTEQAISKNEQVKEAIHENEKDTEAVVALQVLGYTRKEIEKALEKLNVKINRSNRFKLMRNVLQYAAVFLILFSCFYGGYEYLKPEKYISIVVKPGQDVKKVVLADGTSVWLKGGSTLKYPESFSDENRQVSLQGEAFFEVSKKAETIFSI